MSEEMARAILEAAISEGRCAEFMDCLLDGGSATVDRGTGELVLATSEMLRAMFPDANGLVGEV